jgi:tRNA modification GTPase
LGETTEKELTASAAAETDDAAEAAETGGDGGGAVTEAEADDAVASETIAAVITAPGLGAMGAVRLSGPAAFPAAAAVFRSKNGRPMEELGAYSLTFGGLYLADTFVDQALLLKMKSPTSFTGEDVAELQCHGGPVVLSRLLSALTELPGLDIRPARPGEFSQRAFLNGKMDLSQAEAVMELVGASNQRAAAAAADQLAGGLSRPIREIKDRLLTLLAEIEFAIDFPELAAEAVDEPPADGAGSGAGAGLAGELASLLAQVEALLAAAGLGRIYREGARLVFYGRPNAGKSSLLNGILREPRAIVTAEPGTTRDTLEERVLLRGIPVILTDTAGIRPAGNPAERAGVERAKQMAAKADLILYVVDAAVGLTDEDRQLLGELEKKKTLVVLNKMDLLPAAAQAESPADSPVKSSVDSPMDSPAGNQFFADDAVLPWQWCLLSALSPTGLEVLAERIGRFFDQGDFYQAGGEILLNRRQEEALLSAKAALRSGAEALARGMPTDLAAVDLRQAWSALGEITGETIQPALVAELFSRFCLGK